MNSAIRIRNAEFNGNTTRRGCDELYNKAPVLGRTGAFSTGKLRIGDLVGEETDPSGFCDFTLLLRLSLLVSLWYRLTCLWLKGRFLSVGEKIQTQQPRTQYE